VVRVHEFRAFLYERTDLCVKSVGQLFERLRFQFDLRFFLFVTTGFLRMFSFEGRIWVKTSASSAKFCLVLLAW